MTGSAPFAFPIAGGLPGAGAGARPTGGQKFGFPCVATRASLHDAAGSHAGAAQTQSSEAPQMKGRAQAAASGSRLGRQS
eukprot:1217963-Prymnesium_polylepis.1